MIKSRRNPCEKTLNRDSLCRGSIISTLRNFGKRKEIPIKFTPFFLINRDGKSQIVLDKGYLSNILYNVYFRGTEYLRRLNIDEDLVWCLVKLLLFANEYNNGEDYSGIKLQLDKKYLDKENSISIIMFGMGYFRKWLVRSDPLDHLIDRINDLSYIRRDIDVFLHLLKSSCNKVSNRSLSNEPTGLKDVRDEKEIDTTQHLLNRVDKNCLKNVPNNQLPAASLISKPIPPNPLLIAKLQYARIRKPNVF